MLGKPSDQSAVFMSQTKRPIFADKKQRGLQTNKLSQYYEEISRNNRSELNVVEKYQNMFPNPSSKRFNNDENDYDLA